MSSLPSRSARAFFTLLLLFSTLARAVPVGAQDATSTPESSIVGNTYTSPDFGYTLSWDDSVWRVSDEYAEPGYNELELESDITTLYVESLYFYDGDPQQCIDGERQRGAEAAGLDDLTPLTDDSGTAIASSDDSSAFAAFGIPSADNPDTMDTIVEIECRVIIPGSAVLILTSFFGPDDGAEAESQVTEVTDTIAFAEGGASSVQFDANDIEQIARLSGADISSYWRGIFAKLGQDYIDPKFISYQEPTETPCGDAEPGADGRSTVPTTRRCIWISVSSRRRCSRWEWWCCKTSSRTRSGITSKLCLV